VTESRAVTFLSASVRKLWGESGTTWPPFPNLPVETGAKFALCSERLPALLSR